MSDQDYGDQPASLAEARAVRATDPHLWTPRDALVSALRAIDTGEISPDGIVICASQPSGVRNGFLTSFFIAGVCTRTAVGLMEAVKFDLLRRDEP